MQTSAGRGEREKGCRCDRKWFCVATWLEQDGLLPRFWILLVVSLPSVDSVAVVALTLSVFSVLLLWVHTLRVLQLLILVCPCRLAFSVILFPMHFVM